MENNQQNRGRQEQEQGMQRGQQQDNQLTEQPSESLNTSSQQPVQNLRDGEVGSGRSYDYGASSSPEQGIEGDAASQ